ncbi:MAG: hypothetical protein H3Z51_00455 [archaeon]|nr:hypothetical protein [archaeon]
MPNLEVYGWGNGSYSSIDYPYYGIHDAIADTVYQKLKNHNETMAEWITDFYLDSNGLKWGDYEYSFKRSSDNWLGYTDDPDSYFMDWSNHMYYVHPYGTHDERGAPDRVKQLYNWVVGNLTNWIKNGRPTRSEDEHKAAYAAGLLAHYFSDIAQFGHTDYTKQDRTNVLVGSGTYHNNYESRQIDTAFLNQLLADLSAYNFDIDVIIMNPKDITIQLAEWVNSYDGTTVLYYDAPIEENVLVGSTYAQMLTDYVNNYDSELEYLGARGHTQQLYQQTLSHIRAAVGNLTQILYTAYKVAESAQTESEITINLSTSSLTLGSSLEVSGTIIPSPSNTVQVTLTFIQPDEGVLTYTVNSTSTGSYSYTFSPDVAGDWSVKASCEGVTSQTEYFKLNPQELDIKILFLVAIVSLVMVGLLVHYITKRR